MAAIAQNIFFTSVLNNTPRLLGQLNRNPLSAAYGSFDRAFWHYRTNDISNARYQEAALTLALLYANDFSGNIYFNNARLLEWINAALEFATSVQNNDGSFNEWYLNEKSFVATAFVCAALAETIFTIGKDKIKKYNQILGGLEKAARWIINHDEKEAVNQLSGGILALERVYRLTGKENYRADSRKKLAGLLKRQSPEGWWSEYGGPDVGYLSLLVDYLAKHNQLDYSEKVSAALEKASDFLVNFLHPNFTAGGEYMARNTEYIIPSGLALLAATTESAKLITAFNLAALAAGTMSPSALDDRYLCYILYNWLEAGLYLDKGSWNTAEFDIVSYLKTRKIDAFFKLSGLKVKQNEDYYFVANLYKGGAFRLYAAKGQYLDSGVEIKYEGQGLISNVLDYSNQAISKNNLLETSGKLKPIKEPLMRTGRMVLFKSWQIIFGKIDWLQVLLKKVLRKKMISYAGASNIHFKREFIFEDKNLIVKDWVSAPVEEGNFQSGLKTSYNFIPSAKFFIPQEIMSANLVEKDYCRAERECSLKRRIGFN